MNCCGLWAGHPPMLRNNEDNSTPNQQSTQIKKIYLFIGVEGWKDSEMKPIAPSKSMKQLNKVRLICWLRQRWRNGTARKGAAALRPAEWPKRSKTKGMEFVWFIKQMEWVWFCGAGLPSSLFLLFFSSFFIHQTTQMELLFDWIEENKLIYFWLWVIGRRPLSAGPFRSNQLHWFPLQLLWFELLMKERRIVVLLKKFD